MKQKSLRLQHSWPLSTLFILIVLSLDGCEKPVKPFAEYIARTVRVMSFNIFHDEHSSDRELPGWSGRKDIVVGTIRSSRPDVVGLQEAFMWQVEEIIAELPDYAFKGTGREEDGDGESVSILYKKDEFDRMDSGHFWFSDEPNEQGSRGTELCWGQIGIPRMVTWVRLRRKHTDKSFYVFNTHLPTDGTASNGPLARFRSVHLLAKKIADRDHPEEFFMITGDFNVGEDDLPMQYLKGEIWYESAIDVAFLATCGILPHNTPSKAIDSYRAAHPSGGSGSRCKNQNSETGGRIDFILVSDNPEEQAIINKEYTLVVDKWGNQCPSDHRAVLAEFVLPRTAVFND